MRLETNWKKVLVVVGLLVMVGGSGFGWLMSSVEMANRGAVMEIKNKIFGYWLPELGMEEVFPFEIICVQEVNAFEERGYSYLMRGKYRSVDLEKKKIYLETKKGNVYGFRYDYDHSPSEGFGYREMSDGVKREVMFEETPLVYGDRVLVQWIDRRKLKQIYEEVEVGEGAREINEAFGTEQDLMLVVKVK